MLDSDKCYDLIKNQKNTIVLHRNIIDPERSHEEKDDCWCKPILIDPKCAKEEWLVVFNIIKTKEYYGEEYFTRILISLQMIVQ